MMQFSTAAFTAPQPAELGTCRGHSGLCNGPDFASGIIKGNDIALETGELVSSPG